MATVTVRRGAQVFNLPVNDLGVIDATDVFNTAEFMRGGPAAWALNRSVDRIEARSLHHWAGWFGPRLAWGATLQQEFDQLLGCAIFHRAKYGIGPAYWLVGFPSGRVWAVGKYGTHRASVGGYSPTSRKPWNRVLVALAMAGNYEVEPVTDGVAAAIRTGMAEFATWPGVAQDSPIIEHGLTPTVNSAGVRYGQATACPGRNIATWRAQGGLVVPGTGEPSYEPPAGYDDGYSAAWGVAYTQGHTDGQRAGHAWTVAETEERLEGIRYEVQAVEVPPVRKAG